MNDLFNSPFFQNLKSGQLPTVEVSLNANSLAILGATLFLVLVAAMLTSKILSKF